MARSIELTQDRVAVVDDADYEPLSRWSWCYHKTGYAVRSQKYRKPDGSKSTRLIRMHRVIADPPEHLYVDHADGNTLNNTRANLRICTKAENAWNTKSYAHRSSAYKGVYYDKKGRRFVAQIQEKNQKHHLGSFQSEEDAALAYNEAALGFHGEFGQINIMPHLVQFFLVANSLAFEQGQPPGTLLGHIRRERADAATDA